MAKLTLSVDGVLVKEMSLTKERITIGRKPHNDLVIDNLAVSGEHAVIITILNDCFLEDLGSTNGTFVNGHPVKKHFLQNADVIELGKYKLKFSTDTSPTELPAEKISLARRRDEMNAADSATASPPKEEGSETNVATMPLAVDGASAGQAMVRLLDGPHAGRELRLNKALTTLGVTGGQVAVITRRPHGYFLTHVQGAQFPILNGEALGPEARLLSHHDIFELSGTQMEFLLLP